MNILINVPRCDNNLFPTKENDQKSEHNEEVKKDTNKPKSIPKKKSKEEASYRDHDEVPTQNNNNDEEPQSEHNEKEEIESIRKDSQEANESDSDSIDLESEPHLLSELKEFESEGMVKLFYSQTSPNSFKYHYIT